MTREEIKAEIARIQAQGRKTNALQNEGGEGYDHTDSKRIDELVDMLVAMEHAEWTRDITITRRAAWNAELKRQGNAATEESLRKKLGYGLDDLRAAVSRHGLA